MSTESSLPQIYFHITGFGKFQGIDDNPSGKLVRTLSTTPLSLRPASFGSSTSSSSSSSSSPLSVLSSPSPPPCIIQSTQVAEVSVEGAEQVLNVIQQDIQKINQESLLSSTSTSSVSSSINQVYIPVYHVWLHFGVAAGAPCFFLEQVGYNDKSFRIPDEQGYQPKAEPIEPQVPWAQVRHTYLVVRDLVSNLQSKGYMAVQASRDPGRFLCNYIYYRSLQLGNNLNTVWAKNEQIYFDPTDPIQPLPPNLSLFIHVPNYDVISIEDQVKFAWDTMDEIAKAIYKNKGIIPRKSTPSSSSSPSSEPLVPSDLPTVVGDNTNTNSLDTDQYILDIKSGVFDSNKSLPADHGNLRGSTASVLGDTIEKSSVYLGLIEIGFPSRICRKAIEILGEEVTVDTALEWILVHHDNPLFASDKTSTTDGTSSSSSSSSSSTTPFFNLPDALDTVTNTIKSIFTRLKMVIVVRTDLEMTKGKIAAQACHVALKCVRKLNKQSEMRRTVKLWETHGEPIVILKGDSLEQLRALYQAAQEKNLPAYFIQDAGRTQVDPGTVTVLGIGPAEESLIDSVTGRLKLL